MGRATRRTPPAEGRPEDDSGDGGRHRLALTRVLMWAEREASAIDRPDVSDLLKKAIAALHQPR